MDRKNSLLYPMMIVAAVSVILFSVVGIATMTGHMPSASSQSRDTDAQQEVVGQNAPSRAAAVRSSCAGCGVVDAVRTVEVRSEGSGVGMVAGGITGGVLGNQFGGGSGRAIATVAGAAGGAYVGNEIERGMKKRTVYRVSVRMDDGSIRTLTQSTSPGFGVGEKVRIVDGQVVARG